MTSIGAATVLIPPTPEQAEVAVEQPPASSEPARQAVAVPHPPAPPVPPPPPVTKGPLIVTKESSPQDIVLAIVGHGHAAGLNTEQIKTVIATAKIESGFRPAVSGGVQAYGGPGTAADEVIGLFQEKASFGTVAERQDPNTAITRFIKRFLEAYPKYGIADDHVQAATLAQNPQLRKRNGGVGSHYYRTVQRAMGEAHDLYHQAVTPPPPPPPLT
ncbi:hypothetical protein ACQI4F_14835 [Mycolicibacterium vaccae]|uniref:hypothetical protein n=1 Tax=Mycolicibacterium vaccae TaxID=1810 RepID=UPI003CF71C0F